MSLLRGTEGSNPSLSSGESDELGGRRIGVLPPWIFGHGGKETLLHHSIPLTTRTSPMNRPKISRVINLANELIARADIVLSEEEDGYFILGTKAATGALRRTSMELTRALADLATNTTPSRAGSRRCRASY
jgi:hypothetical protein